MSDWTGNKHTPFSQIGARNYAKEEREENDFYATEPKAVELILERERFKDTVWECACGQGRIAKVIEDNGYKVYATDLIDRGYGEVLDFMKVDKLPCDCDIVTNPPYKIGKEFIEHALKIAPIGTKIAMFLKVQFLEGKSRKYFFHKYPPKVIYVSSGRLHCAMNGDFEKYMNSNAIAYAWFVWVKGYKGDTIVKWM